MAAPGGGRRPDFSSPGAGPSPAGPSSGGGAGGGRRLLRTQTVGNMGESIFDSEVVPSSLVEIAPSSVSPRRSSQETTESHTSDELQWTNLELQNFKDEIKENQEKIKLNKQLPYLVGNIVKVLSPRLSKTGAFTRPPGSYLISSNAAGKIVALDADDTAAPT